MYQKTNPVSWSTTTEQLDRVFRSLHHYRFDRKLYRQFEHQKSSKGIPPIEPILQQEHYRTSYLIPHISHLQSFQSFCNLLLHNKDGDQSRDCEARPPQPPYGTNLPPLNHHAVVFLHPTIPPSPDGRTKLRHTSLMEYIQRSSHRLFNPGQQNTYGISQMIGWKVNFPDRSRIMPCVDSWDR